MAYAPYQQSFFDRMWPQAQKASVLSGIDPRIIFAQSALESNWGRSAPNNNYFGIKGPGGTQTTKEFLNGKWVTIQDSFRGYSSMEESVMGYTNFMQSNKRYKPMLSAIGLDNQLTELGKSGYATDPNYTGKLKSIINNLPGSAAKSIGGAIGDLENVGKTVVNAAGDAVNIAKDAAQVAGYIATGNWLAAGAEALDMVGIDVPGMGQSEDEGIIAKFFKWLKNLFSANTAARFAAIVVGFILVAAAIFYLTGTDKVLVEGAKTAAKVVV